MRQAGLLAGVLLCALALAGAGAGANAATTSGRFVVVLKDGADVATTVEQHKKKYGAEVGYVYRYALKGYAARLSSSALEALKTDPGVVAISEDNVFQAASTCSGADGNASPGGLYETQCLSTGVDRIDADRSGARSGDGKGSVAVNVAVLDTVSISIIRI